MIQRFGSRQVPLFAVASLGVSSGVALTALCTGARARVADTSLGQG
jgi:hypothetical protein